MQLPNLGVQRCWNARKDGPPQRRAACIPHLAEMPSLASVARVLVGLATALGARGQTATPPPAEVLDRYLSARRSSPEASQHSVEVEIDAAVPRLKKRGGMKGLRLVASDGAVTYHRLVFSGDATVKTAVIARFLSADIAPRRGLDELAISPANYRFDARGAADYAGRTAYVYKIEPKRKKAGLFRGELWLDAKTGAPLREIGRFVKSPSVFVRSVNFVHDYFVEGGRSRSRRLILNVRTLLVGDADLTVWYGARPCQEGR
jgi:hypothetical protein